MDTFDDSGQGTIRSVAACGRCNQPFEPVKRGDRRKVFCSTPCRMAFHKVVVASMKGDCPPCTAQGIAWEAWRLPDQPPASTRISESPAGFCGHCRLGTIK